MDQAQVLIFTGDGKGKTTAALGLVLRAVGHGRRCLVAHFVKKPETAGEYRVLPTLPGVEELVLGLGFPPAPGTPGWEAHRQAALDGWRRVVEKTAATPYDTLVLDEACGALYAGLLDLAPVLEWLERRPGGQTVVFTGRNAPAALVERADTVTEMRLVKHAYQRGIPARPGVEF